MQARALRGNLGARGIPPRAAWGAALGAALLVAPARGAKDDHVPIILNYTAPLECPAADRFLSEVASRTALFRPAEPNEPGTTLTVVIKEVRGGHRGTLKLEAQDGATSSRHVSAADCEQIVSALALMTALAIDPNASTASTATVAKPPPPAAPVAPSVLNTPPPVAAPERSSAPRRIRFQVGMGLEALGGVAPKPLLLVRPYAELGSSGPSRWSSALRLSVGFGRKVVRESSEGAEYTLLAGRLEGCPARFRAWHAVQISPCVAMDAGRLEVVGIGITPAERVTPPWIAPGALLRLQWEIVDVLVLDIAGEAFLPLERSRFFVDAGTTLHRTPVVAGGATAALGVRFP